MLVYDITLNRELPFDYPNGRIIRCVYDYNGVISILSGMHLENGVNLFLGARPNASIETWSNPIHHHISILSNNPEPYAEKFNTKRFILEYHRKDKESFLKNRFPQWNLLSVSPDGYPLMELTL